MSVITYSIVQWDGADGFLDVINHYLDDPERNQKFGLLTDFNIRHLPYYGLKGAGGSKWYALTVAAAAFHHLSPEKIRYAVETAYKSAKYKPAFVSLVIHPDNGKYIFLYKSELHGDFESRG